MRAQGPRIACVDVPALPLQLLARQRPEWCEHPMVVVESDWPLAAVLWLNRNARRVGLKRNMKFGQAQSLCNELRAAVVPQQKVQAAVDELFGALLLYSPVVEPDADRPGVFWLDPEGLQYLFGNHQQWAAGVHQALVGRGFVAAVVVGFRRFFTLAVARTSNGPTVLSDPAQERRLACRVRLDRLEASPRLCAEMALLGVDTLGKFLKLRPADLAVRYGPQTAELVELFGARRFMPLQGRELVLPLRLQREIEPPDSDQSRLLFVIKGMLQQLVERLLQRGEKITALRLLLQLDHAPPHTERIETAAPTLDVVRIVDLVRLRLQTVELAAPVEQIELEAESLRLHPLQLGLLHTRERRDLQAAARALARVKAVFGPDAVTRARLCNAYLPEAAFCWEPVAEVRAPRSADERGYTGDPPLIRRIFARRMALTARFGHRGEMRLGPRTAVDQMFGPYRVSGGWWHRRLERDYYFVETEGGEILWIYHDQPRRRWVLHGVVE